MNKLLVYRLLAGMAIVVQVLLLYYFFVMGLGWGGFWYLANLAQALVVLVIAGVLMVKHPLLAVPLPIVSLLLMLALHGLDPSTKTRDCSEAELAAVAQLPPPPGSPPPTFQSEPTEGCIARFTSNLPAAKVLDHYRLAATKAGWQLQDEPPETHSLAMSNDTMTVAVAAIPQEQGLVIVSVYERRR